MVFYCDTTAGTCNNFFNDYFYRNSTTSYYSNGWNYPSSTGTISGLIPYGYTDTGTEHNIQYPEIQKIVYKPSDQELLRQREEKARAEEIAKKAKKEAEEAAKKARSSLLEYLDDENIKRLTSREPLEVPSRLFVDIKYHIPISNGRIEARKENKVVSELCLAIRGSGHLPEDDIILTKFLYVLHDEENMLRTANHFNTQENLLARLN